MLEELTIENLGVIGAARVPFGPGMTAITGETGAGKTMLLTGLSLLMGGKADAARVRTGADEAAVEGRIQVPPDGAAAARVAEAGGTLDDDGTLVVLRTVSAHGRSRAHAGGRSVPRALLAEVAEELITVHGQADQLRLRSPQRQREALDSYAGPEHRGVLEQYRAAWAERTARQRELEELRAASAYRDREVERLRLGLAEIERIDPVPGEDHDLDAEIRRLANVEDLRQGALLALAALSGDDLAATDAPSAVALVETARRALESAGVQDDVLAAQAERLADLGFQLADVGSELTGYLDALVSDPARLESAQARRAELTHLTRSYGHDVDEVLAWAGTAGLRLLALEGRDERADALGAQVDALTQRLRVLAGELGTGRRAAARELAQAVTAELDGLAMAGAELVVEVTEDGSDPGPWGADAVVMSLVPHRGAPASPLGKGASGGELSRVMLAIEVALTGSGSQAVPTLVFDEVDAGVGGRAALEVGRRLAQLGRGAQVVVVTHLAQVAAFADRQVVVTKSSDGTGDVITRSDVRAVEGEERVAELARMLSGQQDSAAAREHAAELLEAARVG
ncbi:MAG: DNA repair protein RecN [Cellulomonadaceae bacterium]